MRKKIKINKCILECPKCNEKFAEVKFGPKGVVYPKDVRLLKGNKIFKDGDALTCTLCDYQYTTWDMTLAIAQQGVKKNDKNS